MSDYEPYEDEFTATVEVLTKTILDYGDPYELADAYDDKEEAYEGIHTYVDQALRDEPQRIIEELETYKWENEGDEKSCNMLSNLIDRVKQEFMPDEPEAPSGKDLSPLPCASQDSSRSAQAGLSM